MDALLRSPRVARDLDVATTRRTRMTDDAVNADVRPTRRQGRAARQAAAEALDARRDQRLDQSRQACRRHLDPGRRAAQASVQRQEGGPRGHARSARLRRAAGRLRRGDQDRAGRAGRHEVLSLPRAMGRGDRHRRRRGRDRRALRARPSRAEIEALLPRFVGVIHADAADLFGDQDRRRARLRSRARRREFEIAARRSSSIGSI